MPENPLYVFKTIPEVMWIGMFLPVASFINTAMVGAGVDEDITRMFAMAAPLTIRFFVGWVNAGYSFGTIIELVWVGVVAAVGGLAAILSNTQDVHTVTGTYAIVTFMAVARTFGGAILGAVSNRIESGGEL